MRREATIELIKRVMKDDYLHLELLDYELRIPRGGTTGALTEVSITWHDGERTFRTRGVNANQVFAGIEATLRMLNVRLHHFPDRAAEPRAATSRG
jgi:D-citramalate synthase